MISIHPLTPAGIEPVLAIAAASPEAAAWSRTAYQELLEHPERGCCFVAEQAGAIAGFACYRLVGQDAELLNLAVPPAHRRQGIGSRLLEHVLREAQGREAARIFLEVRESNAAALRLYQQYGFQVSGRRAGYYSNPPGDAVLLQRPLPLS